MRVPSVLALSLVVSFAASSGEPAATPLELAGFPGGICVQIGCANPKALPALRGGGKFLVHAIALTDDTLANTRQALTEMGVYGDVSAEKAPLSALPYAENLINVVIVEDLEAATQAQLSIKEILRVPTPDGVALFGAEAVEHLLVAANMLDDDPKLAGDVVDHP